MELSLDAIGDSARGADSGADRERQVGAALALADDVDGDAAARRGSSTPTPCRSMTACAS